MQNNNQSDHTNIDIGIEKEIAPYIDTLALNAHPFSAEIPGKHYFILPDRQQHLDQLSHLIQSSDMVLVVVGEKGSGKSTLIQQFKSLPNNNLKCCYLTADLDYTEHDIVANLSRCLDLPDDLNTQVMLQLIREQTTQLHRSDTIPTIVVDDAYKLSEQTLRFLLQLQDNQNESSNQTEASWRIILFTQPSHSPELIQLKDRLHFIQLSGLGIEQTRHYLTYRLQAAGFKGENPFSEKDLIIIQKNSQGNLVKIHQQAHEILLKKPATSATPKTKHSSNIVLRIMPTILKPRIILSALAVIAISTILYYQSDINQALQQTKTNTPAATQLIPTEKYKILARIPDEQTVDWSSIPALSINQTNSKTDKSSKIVTTESPEQLLQKPQAVSIKNTTKKITQNIATTTDKHVITTKPTEAPPKYINNSLNTLLSKNNIKDKNWILKQDKHAATAQIMASSKPDLLIKYANNASLKGKTAIYHINRNKSDWYVLIYGNAQNKAAMQEVLNALPPQLRKNRPWVRKFNDVQAEVVAGKK